MAQPLAASIRDLRFANSLPRRLRADPLTSGADSPASHQPRPVMGAHFSYVRPQPPPDSDDPKAPASAILISVCADAARSLVGLEPPPPSRLVDQHRQQQPNTTDADKQRLHDFVDVMCGKTVPEGTHPWSLSYGGHQFGVWAGQLGDGRAITLGEVAVRSQAADARCEIQLKGAGLTPFSRFADGLAVLRSSIREYLCAEAMHALGVPTSRSLALVATPTRYAMREEGPELGAIVCRLAPTWIRFGSFEIHYSRGEFDLLRELADYTIETHFPDVIEEATKVASAANVNAVATTTSTTDDVDPESDAIRSHLACNKYLIWFRRVIEKTADMIAHWQSVGFCHGVMNTDNFSIIGITIDYGPFQFMDTYEPEYVCNHSDEMGRYAFCEQPRIALWNLTRLASVIDPLLMRQMPLSPSEFSASVTTKEAKAVNEALVDAIRAFVPRWDATFCRLMSRKLGFTTQRNDDLTQMYQPLLRLMHDAKLDYTHFFRALSRLTIVSERLDDDTFDAWQKVSLLSKAEWSRRPLAEKTDSDASSPSSPNPPGSPGPGLSIIDRFQSWYKAYRSRIFDESNITNTTIDTTLITTHLDTRRQQAMRAVNPKYTLRNHLVQTVIDQTGADPACSNAVDRYLRVLQHPFDEGSDEDERLFGGVVPSSARGIKCSCSS